MGRQAGGAPVQLGSYTSAHDALLNGGCGRRRACCPSIACVVERACLEGTARNGRAMAGETAWQRAASGAPAKPPAGGSSECPRSRGCPAPGQQQQRGTAAAAAAACSLSILVSRGCGTGPAADAAAVRRCGRRGDRRLLRLRGVRAVRQCARLLAALPGVAPRRARGVRMVEKVPQHAGAAGRICAQPSTARSCRSSCRLQRGAAQLKGHAARAVRPRRGPSKFWPQTLPRSSCRTGSNASE
jgi:hypothetical protein